MNENVTQVQYSVKEVEFLLGYYLEYRSNLISPTAVPEDPCIRGEYKSNHRWKHELPLGHTRTASPWPYMVKANAQTKVDGKRRASKAQDVHVAMVDLEHGLRCLTDNYLEVIYKCCLFQSHSLTEVAQESGLNHESTIMRRRDSAIKALTRHMNAGAKPIQL